MSEYYNNIAGATSEPIVNYQQCFKVQTDAAQILVRLYFKPLQKKLL